jgi:hypothetical protein
MDKTDRDVLIGFLDRTRRDHACIAGTDGNSYVSLQPDNSTRLDARFSFDSVGRHDGFSVGPPVHAIVTYEYDGCKGVCGQQVGADGAGLYAVIVYSADDLATYLTKIRASRRIRAARVYDGDALSTFPF